MVDRWAIWFGLIMLIAGILGFIPALAPNGLLFGIFAVDALHNIVHLATGIVALVVGYTSYAASRTFFQVFAVVYGLVALLGLFYGNAALLGIMAHNWADFWLHIVITAFAAYAGYFTPAAHRVTTTAGAGHH